MLKRYANRQAPEPVVIEELIKQFLDNNSDWAAVDTLRTLGSLAAEAFGQSADIKKFLGRARKHFSEVDELQYERQNYRNESDERLRQKDEDRIRNDKQELNRIAAETNPADLDSLVEAINQLNALENKYKLKDGFFEALRDKVSYGERERYIQIIAKLENSYFYWKLDELECAKQAWGDFSVSLSQVFKSLAVPLTNECAEDMIDSCLTRVSA